MNYVNNFKEKTTKALKYNWQIKHTQSMQGKKYLSTIQLSL